MNRFRMANESWNARAGRNQLDSGIHDLLGLNRHLPLFFRETVIHEDIDVRDHVEGDLLGETIWCRRIINENAFGLIPKFVHRLATPHRTLTGM